MGSNTALNSYEGRLNTCKRLTICPTQRLITLRSKLLSQGLFPFRKRLKDRPQQQTRCRKSVPPTIQSRFYTIFFNPQSLLGKKANIDNKPFHIADIKETWANNDKAKKLLEWEPRVSIDEGLEKSVQWYVDNQEWLKDIEV